MPIGSRAEIVDHVCAGHAHVDVEPRDSECMVVVPDGRRELRVGVGVDIAARALSACVGRIAVEPSVHVRRTRPGEARRVPGIGSAVHPARLLATVNVRHDRDLAERVVERRDAGDRVDRIGTGSRERLTKRVGPVKRRVHGHGMCDAVQVVAPRYLGRRAARDQERVTQIRVLDRSHRGVEACRPVAPHGRGGHLRVHLGPVLIDAHIVGVDAAYVDRRVRRQEVGDWQRIRGTS